jgi:hypothetical protein
MLCNAQKSQAAEKGEKYCWQKDEKSIEKVNPKNQEQKGQEPHIAENIQTQKADSFEEVMAEIYFPDSMKGYDQPPANIDQQ